MADNFYASYPVEGGGGGSGTVTSVGLSLPNIFIVSGSPVTTSGTLTGTLATEPANTVFSGPASGPDAIPTFRALVPADIPSLSTVYANVNLSNLASPTSVNQDLLPSADALRSLGSASSVWLQGFIENVSAGPYPLTLNGAGIVASNNLIHNVLDPVSAQDAATKNYVDTAIPAAITKTPNTFAGFDGTGLLESVPGFTINTTSGGMDVFLLEQPNNGGGFSAYNQSVNFDPLQNSPNENWNIYNYGVSFDVNNSGFSQGTGGNAVQILNLNFNHQNTGEIGQLVYLNLNSNIGNGTDPLTTNGMIASAFNPNYGANVTLNNGIQGYTFNPNVNAAAIAGTNFNVGGFSDFSSIGIGVNNYTTFSAGPNLANILNNSNYTGVAISPNITALTGNASAYGYGFYPTLTTMSASGGAVALNANPTITTMGASGYYHGLDIFGNITTSHGSIQGVNIQPNITGGDASFIGINIGPNGGYTSPNVQGINISLNSINSTAQKVGLNINDGSIQVSANYDTSILPPSPGFVNLNGIGGEYHVAPGFPVTGTLVLANGFNVAGLFEDNMGPDAFGGLLGFTSNVLMSQTAVAITKTVDTFTAAAIGASVPDVSGLGITDGGTITNFNTLSVIGPLNQGGSIVITNLKSINIPSGSNAYSATNAWGIYCADTTLDNWFAKDVVVGGVTGKPIATEVLSVTGDSLLNGLVDVATHQIINVLDPVNPQDAATKNYVDSVASGLNPIQAVQAASVANVAGTYANGVAGIGATFTTTSLATFTLDGYTPTLGQRVLLKNQSSGFQNGVYNVTQLATGILPAILTRSLDYNTPAAINAGDLIPVINGTMNFDTSWLQTATVTTVGTDPLVFVLWTANPASYLLKANNLSDVASPSAAFANISPLTTAGDIIYEDNSPAPARLPIGSTGDILTVVAGLPAWAPVSSGSLYDLVVGPTQAYTTIGAVIAAAVAGQSIFIQTGTYAENPVIDKQLNITGSGRGVVISGSLTFDTGSDDSFIQGFKVTGNLNINSGVSEVQVISFWNGSASIISDNGTGTFIQGMQE